MQNLPNIHFDFYITGKTSGKFYHPMILYCLSHLKIYNDHTVPASSCQVPALSGPIWLILVAVSLETLASTCSLLLGDFSLYMFFTPGTGYADMF